MENENKIDYLAKVLGLNLDDPKEQAFLEMHEDRYKIFDFLYHERIKQGYTLEDISKVLGISVLELDIIERESRDPKITTLIRYAEFLGVPLSFKINKDY